MPNNMLRKQVFFNREKLWGKSWLPSSRNSKDAPSQGPAVPMDRLDDAVIDFLRSTLLVPERIEALMTPLLAHREDWTDRRRQHVVELRAQADEDRKSTRLNSSH